MNIKNIEPLVQGRYTMKFFDNTGKDIHISEEAPGSWSLYTKDSQVLFDFDLRCFLDSTVSPNDILCISKILILFEGPTGNIIKTLKLDIKSLGFVLNGNFDSDDIVTYKVGAIVKQTKLD